MNVAGTVWNGVKAIRSQYADSKKLNRIRDSRIRAMVDYAYWNVPYYHSAMNERKLRPSDIRTKEDLKKLPTISKSTILRNPSAFVSRQIPRGNCIVLRSSGASGTAILGIPYEKSAIFTHMSVSQRWNYLINEKLKRYFLVKQAYIMALGNNFQRIGEFCEKTRFSSLFREFKFLSTLDRPEVNLAKMKTFRPHVLSSYGSYLELLVRYVGLQDVKWELPKVVVFSADTLKAEIRRSLEQTHSCHVLGLYGATEALGIGFECEAHRGYHVCEDYYPVDLVSAKGDYVGEGESGEVVVSNLTNRAMVILNYRLRDIAVRGEDVCECRRHLPMLSKLEGRVEDIISLPDGRLVSPISVLSIFDSRSDIGPYQLVQESLVRFEVRIVPLLRGDNERIEAELSRDLHTLFGEDALIKFKFLPELPVPESGKLRTVRSNVTLTGYF